MASLKCNNEFLHGLKLENLKVELRMLQQFLENNKESIITKWIDLIIQSYEPAMVRFLQKEKNQFANPVRNTILSSTEKIYEAFLNKTNVDKSYPGLEELIKLRAVQDFSPSEALSFLFCLKNVIKEELGEADQLELSAKESREIDKHMDDLIGVAFDIYSDCRSKIYKIRLAEIKSQSKRAFELLGRQKK